jgi:hypothetical protein
MEKRLEREDHDWSERTDQSLVDEAGKIEVNMVFELPAEFRAPEDEVTELALGAKTAVFQKPEKLGMHMKPLSVRGHLQGKPAQQIMIDGGAGVNIMLLVTFEKMGYKEDELMRTNTSLIAFTREVTDANGVMSAELAVCSKTLTMAFFVVDVGGCYNLLLGRDWIHVNGCVPSTLHQCLIQWIDDDVEVIALEDSVCVALAEARSDTQSGNTACLSRRDLSKYDYISVSKDGLIPVNVKPISLSRLGNISDP